MMEEREREGRPFSLLLLDKQMPVMDGHECVMIARQRGFVGPIVGVTGNALNEQRQDFIAHGATEVIAKPLSKDVLIDILRSRCNYAGAGTVLWRSPLAAAYCALNYMN